MSKGHDLYHPRDFTDEEVERRNVIAVAVLEGGLDVCKRCGAAEDDLTTWPCVTKKTLAMLAFMKRNQAGHALTRGCDSEDFSGLAIKGLLVLTSAGEYRFTAKGLDVAERMGLS